MGSDSDDDEDDTAGLQAQAATMLAPIAKQQKKQGKKIEKLDILLQQMRRVGEEQLPNLRNENAKTMAEQTVRLESVQAEVATLASKTSLELVREEQSASEQRLRKALDEERSKTAALELVVQGLQSRLDAMERAMRASELKTNSEVSAAVAQLSQLNAALERHKGETEARVGEVSARATTQHDGLLLRLAQSEDRGRELQQMLATKSELAELAATVSRRAGETDSGLNAAHEQWRKAHEAVEHIQTSLASSYASSESLEKLDQKLEQTTAEARRLIQEARGHAEKERTSWEDKLLQRQLSLEKEAQEARRDWHRLSAQLEQCQTHVTERALLTEHEALANSVEQLRESTASKQELGQVSEVANGAATGAAFGALESDVRQLQTWSREDDAKLAELKANTASAADHGSLESAVAELKNVVEHKFGQAEAEFALSNKLDKSLGDQMAAEVEAMQQRLTALFERANGVELAMSKADTNVSEARRFVDEIKQDQQELNVKQNDMYGESQTQTSHIQDLIKAIRALTADAEMRAALDEREIEFLWAAPSHIYGSHGWRPNNGSKSERTPYPAGNFKMAVRHGSEGHARDVLAQRRKWLNSITIGQRAAVALENEATAAGTEPDGVPIRLPDIDELKRKGNLSPRSESPMNVLLEPAHKLLSANPPTLGGSVGLTAAPPSGVRSAHPNPSPTRHRTRPPAPDFPDPMTV